MKENKDTKTIAIYGRPKVGKSFLVSLFAEDPYTYRSGCSKAGDVFTQCKVQNIICAGENEPRVEFHYVDYCRQIGEITEKCPLTQEKFPQFMMKKNEYIKERCKAEEDKKDESRIVNEEYFEIYMRPSNMAKEIMKKCKLKKLIITDIPEISEDYGLVPVEKPDLVMIVMNDTSELEACKSYEVLVRELAPLIDSDNVCFIYRVGQQCDNGDEYDKCQKVAKEVMSSFLHSFSNWNEERVHFSIDVLSPEKNVLAIPPMKLDESCKAEEIFTSCYQEKIIEQLSKESKKYDFLQESLDSEGITKEQVVELVKKILDDCQYKEKADIKEEFDLEKFKARKHNRVKTKDNHRLDQLVSRTRRERKKEIYSILKKYILDEYHEKWQQCVIQYLYDMLITYINTDFGAGVGVQSAEAYPATTMLAIESILAEEILDKVICNKDLDKNQKHEMYRSEMERWGVVSDSWDKAIIGSSENEVKRAIIKLRLIKEHLYSIRVESEKELVKCRYIMGLQKLGEYCIWKEILRMYGDAEEECENFAREKMGIKKCQDCHYCAENSIGSNNAQ